MKQKIEMKMIIVIRRKFKFLLFRTYLKRITEQVHMSTTADMMT